MSFIADTFDNAGSFLHLPELGLSETLSNGAPTTNTKAPAGVNLTGSLPTGLPTSLYSYATATGGGTGGMGASGGGGGGGGGGGYTAPLTDQQVQQYNAQVSAQQSAATAAQLGQYDQAINQYNTALGRVDGQLGIAQGNINGQYNSNLRGIDTTKANANQSYGQSTTQNGQSLRTNKNTIADQASAGLRGLLRTLGAYGAGGSSDALYNAPNAVAQQASAQRAGAGQTFAQNQSGLDTNWNQFLGEDKNSRDNLNAWQQNQLNSAQAQSMGTKQDLLSKLAGLHSQRASAAGGNATASAQPYIDQAQGMNSQIDNLGRIAPTYSGPAANYTARPLDSYNAGQGTSTSVDPMSAGGANPYLAMLLSQQRDKTKATF